MPTTDDTARAMTLAGSLTEKGITYTFAVSAMLELRSTPYGLTHFEGDDRDLLALLEEFNVWLSSTHAEAVLAVINTKRRRARNIRETKEVDSCIKVLMSCWARGFTSSLTIRHWNRYVASAFTWGLRLSPEGGPSLSIPRPEEVTHDEIASHSHSDSHLAQQWRSLSEQTRNFAVMYGAGRSTLGGVSNSTRPRASAGIANNTEVNGDPTREVFRQRMQELRSRYAEETQRAAVGARATAEIPPPPPPMPPYGGFGVPPRFFRSSVRPQIGDLELNENNVEGENMATIGSLVGNNPMIERFKPHPLVVQPTVAPGARVGIELEVENAQFSTLTYWQCVTDHSLRNNGIEYVLRQPLGGDDLYGAIVELDSELHRVSPSVNWRCSTHIHLDVRALTVAQFKKLLIAYTLFEGLLFEASGNHRWQNNFCPSFGFAEGQVQRLAEIWGTRPDRFLNSLNTRDSQGDRDKYSSVNFLPIFTQGSLEFRGSEAKVGKGRMLRLVNRILSLYKVAVSHDDLDDEQFLQHLMSAGINGVFSRSLPGKFDLPEDAITKGYYLAQDLINIHKIAQEQRASNEPVINEPSSTDPWENYFDLDEEEVNDMFPMTASAFFEHMNSRDLWGGEFISSEDWAAATEWADASGVTYIR